MGRYNFRAQRVYEQTSRLLSAGRITRRPAWFEVVHDNPPPAILTRTRPLEHGARHTKHKSKKAVGIFRPKEIKYEEDKLRSTFFQDHPWELARPRIVLENDGDNGTETWSSVRQRGRLTNGESVVQRQLYLMDNHKMSKDAAYDQARTELYEERLREDTERRVAREEAQHLGATFGKDRLTIGMELEDKAFQDWREWADKEVTAKEQMRIAGTISVDAETTTVSSQDALVEDDGLTSAISDSDQQPDKVLNNSASQARGGAAAHS